MSRRPCQGNHPEPLPDKECSWCWLYSTSDFHNRLWGGPGLPGGRQLGQRDVGKREDVSPPVTCPHLGSPTGEAVGCRTCENARLKVHHCGKHGLTVLDKLPTSNTIRCCTHCPDNPANSPDPWVNPVRIPQPPRVTVKPTSRRAVVTVAVGRGKELLAISQPWMEAYAKRLGADFHVCTWNPLPHRWPMASKFALGPCLDVWDEVAYLDADTLADPHLCPDLFAATPAGTVGGYDDLPGVTRVSPKFEAEYHRVRGVLGLSPSPLPWYVNTGVLVVRRGHRAVFAPPSLPIPPLHCSEQHWWNARLHDAGVPVTLWDARCNWQFWERKGAGGEFDPPPDALAHFSGLTDHAARLAAMRGRRRAEATGGIDPL